MVWSIILWFYFNPQPYTSPKLRRGAGVRLFSTPTPTPIVTLLTTGDVLLARTINAKSVQDNNFDWPFARTTNLLSNSDLTFINLETPLLENCPVISSGFKFCGSSRNVSALTNAGIDIVNLANNHSGNYGRSGLGATITNLHQANIHTTGTTMNHEPITINGINFAFLGFDDTISSIKLDQLVQLVQSAKSQSDHVIVAIHWGVEYQDQPTSRQKRLGHLAIDSGASLVVGNHPHWIQPIEQYKDGYVYYSHGNFIFDQFWSEATKRGLIVTTTFSKTKIQHIKPQTIYIDPPGIPRLVLLEGIEPPSAVSKTDALIR